MSRTKISYIFAGFEKGSVSVQKNIVEESSEACTSGDLARGKYRDSMGNFTSMLWNEEGYT